ncbi:ParB N-terminal domain-containing protein [Falsiroseomonas sp. CW058]|uniref:ParB/RepB/Spo0J family partition protein n=1 Tax=Falsiroseomonas sp. CW058 TaxID=3388664 RepID=UPI003D31AE13
MTDTIVRATAEIALGRLDPSPANVRRTGAGQGVEALAASIAAHGLLQSLVVRPKGGGRYEVVAGGRRLAALRLLAKAKRLPKGAAVPCHVLDGDAGEDAAEVSLAENVVRQDMHPADQFEAFAALHRGGEGLGVEEIAARFGVSAHTVRQRLRLAAVSPAIVAAYREGALTLDHVTAFAVTDDREAQERVFAGLAEWQRTPATIRRLLTDALLPTTDRRVALVGLDAYEAAGGRVQRDLFSEDGGGWIADPALLEELVGRRMEAEAEAVRAEGWRWVAVGAEASDALWRCRRIWPARAPLTEAEEARRDALSARYDELAEGHSGTDDDLPEAVAAELDAIEAELDALETREAAWRPEDLALAGALVTLAGDGRLAVTRGLVRPEDEPKPAAPHADGRDDEDGEGLDSPGTGEAEAPAAEEDAGDKAPALSAALVAELRAHRTLGLQAELAGRPDLALRVLLHALAGDAFYGRYGDAVASFPAHPPAFAGMAGLADSPARRRVEEAEAEQRGRLPADRRGLWAWLAGQDEASLLRLLAVLVARVADAGAGDWTAPGDTVAAGVASAAGLDMRRWWSATPASYLARVPKAAILAAVREGAGEDAARRLAGMKKEPMAEAAAAALDGRGWLPAALRVPGAVAANDDAAPPALAAE